MVFTIPSGPPSTQPSPRSRRLSRPLPFVQMPPAPSFDTHSRPPSPSFYHSTVAEVQGVLYGGRGRDREEIRRLVDECYDPNATFENPLTLAKGKEAISEMFALLGVVPGSMWSELGDIAESQSYDGNHLVVMQHVLNIAFLPFLDPDAHPSPSSSNALHHSHSFLSLPATPYPQTNPDSHGLFSKTLPASSARWPLSALFSALNPRNVAVSLTTLHLKLHTRLVFNEHGKIIAHEDTWGLKELVEGLFPLVGHLYSVNRAVIAGVLGIASRTLFGRGRPPALDEESSHEVKAGMVTPEMCPLDDLASDSTSYAYPAGSPLATRKTFLPNVNGYHNAATPRRYHGLGLEPGELDARLAEEEQRPTTIDVGNDSS